MGKKSQAKNNKKPLKENATDKLILYRSNAERGFYHKLSPQKRNELNQLVDKLDVYKRQFLYNTHLKNNTENVCKLECTHNVSD